VEQLSEHDWPPNVANNLKKEFFAGGYAHAGEEGIEQHLLQSMPRSLPAHLITCFWQQASALLHAKYESPTPLAKGPNFYRYIWQFDNDREDADKNNISECHSRWATISFWHDVYW
jgi:hypothetical protein